MAVRIVKLFTVSLMAGFVLGNTFGCGTVANSGIKSSATPDLSAPLAKSELAGPFMDQVALALTGWGQDVLQNSGMGSSQPTANYSYNFPAGGNASIRGQYAAGASDKYRILAAEIDILISNLRINYKGMDYTASGNLHLSGNGAQNFNGTAINVSTSGNWSWGLRGSYSCEGGKYNDSCEMTGGLQYSFSGTLTPISYFISGTWNANACEQPHSGSF